MRQGPSIGAAIQIEWLISSCPMSKSADYEDIADYRDNRADSAHFPPPADAAGRISGHAVATQHFD
jgi:hypothetical protein